MIYATSAAEIEAHRRAFIRKWRLKCKAVADSLEEAGDWLFTFTRLPVSQWKSARTTDEIDNKHFSARLPAGFGIGPCSRESYAALSVRRRHGSQEGCEDVALSTPTAAEGGGRRPAFTKPHLRSDNRPWHSRGCSVRSQRRWIV